MLKRPSSLSYWPFLYEPLWFRPLKSLPAQWSPPFWWATIYGVKIPFLSKTIIPIGTPKRGDVIVFIYPVDRSKDFIKRVIGLPGDRIEIIDKTIFINGEPYKDDHGYYSGPSGKLPGASIRRPPFGPETVPDNNLLVLGDNRDHSSDSRVWGYVPLSSIKGKAFIIYWSWPNWKRFLHLIR